MNITLDRKADAVYISLSSSIGDREVSKTYPCDPLAVEGEINLDFNHAGQLVGIEILDASKKLPNELLDIAEIIG